MTNIQPNNFNVMISFYVNYLIKQNKIHYMVGFIK